MDAHSESMLLNEIEVACLDDNISISSLLRKCLVLSYRLRNDTLKEWVEAELNGYSLEGNLPIYRVIGAPAKGLFLGGGNTQINDQPLASAVLKEEHRHFAESVKLFEPIAAYQEIRNNGGKNGRAIVEWPANLTVLYQSKFFGGRYALNRAWQEIPAAAFASIIDTVRTRILTFTLEIQKELGSAPGRAISAIPERAIQSHVVNVILGDHNIVGSTADRMSIQSKSIVLGNFESLKGVLSSLGVGETEINQLQEIAENSEPHLTSDGKLSSKLTDWAKSVGTAVASSGKEIGTTVLTQVLLKYFGVS